MSRWLPGFGIIWLIGAALKWLPGFRGGYRPAGVSRSQQASSRSISAAFRPRGSEDIRKLGIEPAVQ